MIMTVPSICQIHKIELVVQNAKSKGVDQSLIELSKLNEEGIEKKFATEILHAANTRDKESADKAIGEFQKLKNLNEVSKSNILKSEYLIEHAVCYLNKGQFDLAIKLLQESILYSRKLKLKTQLKKASFYLALCYTRLQESVIAIDYCRFVVSRSIRDRDTAQMFNSISLLSINYLFRSAQQGSAKAYKDTILKYADTLKLFLNPNNLKSNALFWVTKAYAYECVGETQEYINSCLKVLNFRTASGDTSNMIATCNNLIYGYLNLRKYDSALVYLNKLDLWKPPKNFLASVDRRNYYYNYYRTLKGVGDIKGALKNLEHWYKQDSMFNYQKNIDYQEQEKVFNDSLNAIKIVETKERESALYQQKKNYVIVISIAVLFIIIALFLFLFQRTRNEREREKIKMQSMLHQAELSALKAQMNPHFIFNALNSIQHSIVSNNTQEAFRFLAKFSKLIRNILDNSIETLVPLLTEIETLKLYLEIESRRFDSSFHYQFILGIDDKHLNNFKISPMIIQPFIENSIWHGLMPKEGDKSLCIEFQSVNPSELTVLVKDNGIGRKKAKELASTSVKKHKSRGLQNIEDRVRLLNQSHKIKVVITTLDLQGLETGTIVEIKFNFN